MTDRHENPFHDYSIDSGPDPFAWIYESNFFSRNERTDRPISYKCAKFEILGYGLNPKKN